MVNKLSLNLQNTDFIIFRSRRKIILNNGIIAVAVNDTEIAKVLGPTTKFLEVHIDNHLTWCAHIRFLAAKIAKNIGVLGRTAYLLLSNIRLTPSIILFASLPVPLVL